MSFTISGVNTWQFSTPTTASLFAKQCKTYLHLLKRFGNKNQNFSQFDLFFQGREEDQDQVADPRLR